ncbi:MAG: hypothetical protein H6740_08350 [Alphaproteobacteria bacterium]|nr:hypothetical protein [Alphaproteobacteria bacterium]
MPLLLLALSALLGCTPTCDQTCRKLIRCEVIESSAVNEDLCSADCSSLENLYDYWDDQQLVNELQETRRCIGESTCEDIADGVCYEEDLYPF